jgi:hypothetical protein
MAGKYQALRVPIALLHQKVYDSGHRLDKWEGIVIRRPAFEQYPSYASYIDRNPARVISPSVGPHYDHIHTLFDSTPYLRKHFFLTDGISKVMCRYCGGEAADAEGRWTHTQTCYTHNDKILAQMVKKGICAICQQPMSESVAFLEYNDCPVCGEECCSCWDYFEPESYTQEALLYKQVLKLKP